MTAQRGRFVCNRLRLQRQIAVSEQFRAAYLLRATRRDIAQRRTRTTRALCIHELRRTHDIVRHRCGRCITCAHA